MSAIDHYHEPVDETATALAIQNTQIVHVKTSKAPSTPIRAKSKRLRKKYIKARQIKIKRAALATRLAASVAFVSIAILAMGIFVRVFGWSASPWDGTWATPVVYYTGPITSLFVAYCVVYVALHLASERDLGEFAQVPGDVLGGCITLTVAVHLVVWLIMTAVEKTGLVPFVATVIYAIQNIFYLVVGASIMTEVCVNRATVI